MTIFQKWLPPAFVFFCVFGGAAIPVALNWRHSQKPETKRDCSFPPETAVEIWTDPETGHRFAVSYRRWRDGVGICLIPEREEENDCPEPALAEKVILESAIGWKEVQ